MQKEQQNDLFSNDHSIIGSLIDNLDKIPEAEIFHKWPSTLVELVELLKCELVRQGYDEREAKSQSSKLVAIMAHYFGGRSFYLPAGSVLQDALRNIMIYNEFTGKNIPELIAKYKLSESQVYAIIREQRALESKRYQQDLFEKVA